MGLDAVEFVMEVEETFGIKIEDDEAVEIRTVGQFSDFIARKLHGINGHDCPTAKSFYRLRRSLISIFGMARKSVRPSTPLLPLLPLWGRSSLWRRLEKDLSLRLPPLSNQSGTCIAWAMWLFPIAAFSTSMAISHDIFVAFAFALFALVPGVLLGYIFGILFLPHTLRPKYRTIGGLARGIVAFNYDKFVPNPPANVESEQVWNQLCELIVKQMGVKRETLHRGTRFVEDIGF
jgi:hypothetical protein